MLKARIPILFRSTLYGVGEALPVDDPSMVAAWIEAGSAYWSDDEETKIAPAIARSVTAQPGMPGLSSDGDPEALIGRVPERTKRSARKKTK